MLPPEHSEEIRAWLAKATHDLRAAIHLSEMADPLLDVAVYHCQQAMEKALKAFLTFKSNPFPRTHALVLLVEQACDLDPGFEALLDHAETLSPFAWRFRYPGELLDPEEAEANAAVALAREALEFVLERVPEETWPDWRPSGSQDDPTP